MSFFGKGGGINRLLDPAGFFGGNKGMSGDQKAASMLTGGFSGLLGENQDNFITKGLADASLFGTSANQKQANINSLGTTPAPTFPGAAGPQDVSQPGVFPGYSQPNYTTGELPVFPSPQSKSIWASYNPNGVK